MGDAGFVSDQRPAGCMMLFCPSMGAMIGLALPLPMSDLLPRDSYQSGNGRAQSLVGPGRLTVMVGCLCGGYVGFRGSELWVIQLVLGAVLYVAPSIVGWVFGGF